MKWWLTKTATYVIVTGITVAANKGGAKAIKHEGV